MGVMDQMTVFPRMVVAGADRAIEFYNAALGAELRHRYTGPSGAVVYAELRVGDCVFSLKDEDDTDRSAASLGGSPVLFTLYVSDADAAANAMAGAGAQVVIPVTDMAYGYRQGRLRDPFGFEWIVSQSIEELTEDERQLRLNVS